MSEKTDIVNVLRAEANSLGEEWPSEAADEIDSLRFELTCITEERDALLNEISYLTQDRDAARADASSAHDRIQMLQNEVRW
jgi:flagellar biosynthesis/type III secretory pathway chaperone